MTETDLKVTKRILKGKITRLEGKSDDLAYMPLLAPKILELEIELNDLHKQIMMQASTDKEQEAAETEFYELCDRLDNLRMKSKTHTDTQEVVVVNSSKNENQSSDSSKFENKSHPEATINLPKIELPSFGGEFSNWLSFKDLFNSTIILNSSLSNIQKLQYLKTCIKGDAALIIQSLPITSENFEIAWSLICDRYDNQAEIINSVLDKLFKQPSVGVESATGLRRLLDVTNQCLCNLESLNQPVKHWDTILIHFLKQKLDNETLRQWILHSSEIQSQTKTTPTFDSFKYFLEQRARGIAALPSGHSKQNQDQMKGWRTKPVDVAKRSVFSHPSSTTSSCQMCSSNTHAIYKCQQFLALNVKEKRDVVRRNQLCFNCLRSSHLSKDCKCSKCKKCNGAHNTLLHEDCNQTENSISTHSASIHQNTCNELVLLPTAVVNIIDINGKSQKCRVLIDSGSQTSFIREDCVQRLRLRRRRTNINVSGISSARVGTAQGIVSFVIDSLNDQLSVNALVLPKITGDLPQTRVDENHLKRFKSLKLADEQCHVPGPIDVLLGADVFHRILLPGRLTTNDESISAIESIFGWIITGQVMSSSTTTVTSHFVQCSTTEFALEKFWAIEEVPNIKNFSLQEQKCEEHFVATHKRNSDGRFMVRLPFYDNVEKMDVTLGSSRDIAEHRLLQIERRFKRQPEKLDLYKDFMKQYHSLGHMEEAPESTNGQYYLPHHAVMKSVDKKSKFRVVFDASAKTTNGVSLNDVLMVGPTIQNDLSSILLHFQKHKIALSADIVKMYRQVLVHPDDCDYQRILWRESPDDPVQEYVLRTVTYGTASAPYLATRCLQQLASDEKPKFPRASSVVSQDFYVDDLMTGADTLEDASQLLKDLRQLLSSGGFDLRKWSSNEEEVLKDLPKEYKATLPMEIDDEVKALGVYWNPTDDIFYFKIQTQDHSTYTKRSVLSAISKIFDPLGWISPVVIQFKLLIQDLWKLQIDWDDHLPDPLIHKWNALLNDLKNIEDFKIPRYVLQPNSTVVELHGFSDASERAYSAVVFIRTISGSGTCKVQMLTSKTRVAPIKHTTLPRLELCGAVLLAKLLKFTKRALNLDSHGTFCWTDSTIVLAWLSSHPSRWKTFVAHRISQIQESLPDANWNHIDGVSNPADCASRGISAAKLNTFSLWWHGPPFLSTQKKLPTTLVKPPEMSQVLLEERKTKSTNHHAHVESSTEDDLLRKYSSLTRLQRITAYVLRFIRNCKVPSDERCLGFLSSDELRSALHFWVKKVQKEEFLSELESLKKTGSVSSKSSLLPLSPFLDKEGIIRVGGRLRHSNLSESSKHPICLPKKHFFTNLVVLHFHLCNLHAGPQLLQACLQLEFWIPGARNLIRQVVRHCVTCVRQQHHPTHQVMGDLPAPRVTPSKPFQHCGVDYAGPFLLRMCKGSRKQTKAYLSLFVCFSTKAVHCELVSDLSTNSFIACLKRFIARRGKPSDLYSDCGTNFVGANKELKMLCKLFQSNAHNSSVSCHLSNNGIRWHFNPPASPHMGGLWEAAVKSVKTHLRRVASNVVLTFEELSTLLAQVEACLNSRPLCPLTNDPNELAVLTPGHFLIGSPLTSLPEPDLTTTKLNRLSRWQLVQRLVQHFWKRWHSEYLVQLQKRSKWNKKGSVCEVGDLVLIRDEGISPLHWKLGRIEEIHPGCDGVVRVVKIKTANGFLTRSVHKISILPVNCDSDN